MKIFFLFVVLAGILFLGCSTEPEPDNHEPVELTPLDLPITRLNVWDIAVRDTLLFVSSYGDYSDYHNRCGLYICNISDPTEPVIIETLAVVTNSLELNDSAIFIGGRSSRIYSVDIREILDIGVLDTLTDFYYPSVVDYADSYLYAVDRLHGFFVIDANDPSDMSIVSVTVTPGGYARGADVSGNYAYVASGAAGVYVFDISSPDSPEQIGHYDTPGYCWSVVLEEGTDVLFVADELEGALALDVSDPTSPEKVGEWTLSGSKLIYVGMHGDLPVFIDEGYGLRASTSAESISSSRASATILS